MRPTIAVGLIALVLIAGCTMYSDSPTKQERPVRLQLNNSIDATPTFEVSVVERPADITVRFHDGRVGTGSITEGITVADSGENQTYKTVELPESARLHGRYTLEPGESEQTAIDDLPVNFAVVIVVYQDENQIVSYVTANCDDLDLAALRVTRTSYGVSVTHSCQ